jgi:redox-sensing transcriptional repressor
MKKEYISQATLKRLPQYLRIIKDKKNEDVKNISSTEIATILRLNPIQVRKDLALVSRTDGKPGVGFNTQELIQDLEEVLNLNNITDAVIIGAGKLGQALLNYKGFEKNLNILMAFDNDKNKCDNKKIFFIDKMEKKIIENNVQIGIITVPKENAQNVCDIMIKSGIKAIWNFAPINLKVPENIAVKNEDLSTSLVILLKKLKEKGV